MATKTKKRQYKTPKLESFGSIEKITHGGSVGSILDTNFTVGTAIDDLTFS